MTRYLRFHRLIWAAAGSASLVIGLAGVVLPLVPTTPFVILAAFCYARGSDRLHTWLMAHPRFGPSLVDWNEHRAISGKAKRMAMLAMLLALLLAVLAGVPAYAIAMQLVALVPVAAFILTRKSPPCQTLERNVPADEAEARFKPRLVSRPTASRWAGTERGNRGSRC